MASTKLIGTASDQVPTNADLGSMAFQDREAVNFLDGKGGLQHLDVTAFSQQLNVNAGDIFVYDTSKDSDGGAWRNRCQNTSWYNETLNTTTRGSRREFPSIAVIVTDGLYVTVYDGDDPLLPMWIVLGRGGGSGGFLVDGYTQAASCVAALNGMMAVGLRNTSNEIGAYGGAVIFNFVKDTGIKYSGTYGSSYSGRGETNTIRGATTADWYGKLLIASSNGLVSGIVNDVAVTLMPNAIIDSITGLPVPTFAFACFTGTSVLHSDGSFNHATFNSSGNYSYDDGMIVRIRFDEAKRLWISQTHRSSQYGASVKVGSFPYAGFTNSFGWGNYTPYPAVGSYLFGGGAEAIKYLAPAKGTDVYAATNCATYGLSVINYAPAAAANSMVAEIRKDYNSGWMPGDIKGAWLSDTISETVVSTNHITNGDFSAGTNSWTAIGNTGFAVSSGQATITLTSTNGEINQILPVLPPGTYTISFDRVGGTHANMYVSLVYTSTGGTAYSVIYANDTTNKTYSGTVTIGANMSLSLRIFGYYWGGTASGQTIVIDNVVIRRADADRSVNNKALTHFGTITKTPVATGADLVAYSGWSGSNYLQQPYNSALTFGTGDFTIAVWFKTSLSSTYNEILDLSDGTNSGRLEFLVGSLGNLYLYTGTAGTSTSTANGVVQANVWNHLVAVRRSGVVFLYVNGILSYNAPNTGSINNTNTKLYIGINYVGGNSTATDQLALIKISATGASTEQIAKMYYDEKQLFQENAKATLYGTSNVVTALAYDEHTKLVHAGTSSGRSVFNGLRRVDNTTTAVATAISASGNLVAEQ